MDDCSKFQADLSDCVFGEISDAREGRLNEHLAGCASCCARERQLLALRDGLRPADPEISLALRERIRASLGQAADRRAQPGLLERCGSWLRRPVPVYAVGIACLLVVVGGRILESKDGATEGTRPVSGSLPREESRFVIAESYATGPAGVEVSIPAVIPARGERPDSL